MKNSVLISIVLGLLVAVGILFFVIGGDEEATGTIVDDATSVQEPVNEEATDAADVRRGHPRPRGLLREFAGPRDGDRRPE